MLFAASAKAISAGSGIFSSSAAKLIGAACGVGMLSVQMSTAQAPTPANVTCDMQLGDDYRRLLADQLVQNPPAATTWQEQLQALVSELRVSKTQYDIKAGQAQLAERNLATILERSRQAQQTVQQLTQQLTEARAELEKLKNGTPPAAN